MAWFPNVPAANQFISASQPEIQQNFQELNTWSQVDHSQPGVGAALNGKHKQSTYIRLAAGPATLADEVALYSKVGAASGVSELFLRRQNSGQERAISEFKGDSSGYSRLASGLLVKWGELISTAGGAAVAIPAAADIPAFTSVYAVQITPIWGGGSNRLFATLAAFNTTTLTVRIADNTGALVDNGFQFLMIGAG